MINSIFSIVSIGYKRSQAKGRRAEIELAGLLRERGYDVRPGEPLNFGREADIVGLAGIHCELKRREGVDLSAALAQAARDAEFFGDGLPTVSTGQPAEMEGHDGA